MKTLEDLKAEWGEKRYRMAMDRVAEKVLAYGGMVTVDEMRAFDKDAIDVISAYRAQYEPLTGVKRMTK